jgi:pimeloyl-ACP methyl ester carboxylesterase
METPHLLLLPGLLNDARLWRAQIDGLAGAADCTVADLTGGESIIALADAVLKQAPARRFALAGLSMGGYVALEVMRQAPERVTALALLDTSARPDTPQATEARCAAMKLSESDFPAVIAALLPKLMLPAHAQDEVLAGVFTAMAERVGQTAFLRQQTAIMNRIDSRPHLGNISCPTLVLCGRADGVTPVEVHEEMAAGIAGSRLAVIEECGHLSALEQPERVTQELREWLSIAIKS